MCRNSTERPYLNIDGYLFIGKATTNVTTGVLCGWGIFRIMANGFYGSKSEWERITIPLECLDRELERFAHAKGLALGRNTKNWPDREFRWEDTLQRLIEIYLADQERLTWTMWICAYEDRPSGRSIKKQTLLDAVPIEKLELQLSDLLESAWTTVTSWSAVDLPPAH